MAITTIDEMRAAHPQTCKRIADEARQSARAQAIRTEGAAAERARILAILTCDAATGRQHMAQHLAFATGLPPDEAARLLAAVPLEAGAMAQYSNPDIGPEVEADSDSASPAAMMEKLRAAGLLR